jgi:tight adherence protein B
MFAVYAVIFFVAFALAGYAITASMREREETKETIKTRLDSQTGVTGEEQGDRPSLLKDLRLSSIGVLNDMLKRISFINKLARTMRQAGLNRRVGEVFLYVPLLGSMGMLGGLFFTDSTMFGALFAALGAALPLLVVERMRKKRMQMFSEQLPDALDLVRSALQAGHSFITALKVVADEFPSPISEEFDTVAEEMRLGLPMRDALTGLQERVDDANIPVLIVGVLVSNESGGNLAEVLDNVAHTVRERFKLLRDVEVMTAQGRLSGLLLTSLPFCVAGGMMVIAPGYVDPLLETTTGHYIIGYCLASVVMGHLWIQKIVRIKV